jgi:hypothetical protein
MILTPSDDNVEVAVTAAVVVVDVVVAAVVNVDVVVDIVVVVVVVYSVTNPKFINYFFWNDAARFVATLRFLSATIKFNFKSFRKKILLPECIDWILDPILQDFSDEICTVFICSCLQVFKNIFLMM